MNNIFHINLGGIPLTIDEDAYSILKAYLLELHKHFEHADEKEEITDGIEQRLGEILSENGKDDLIVSKDMVEHAIQIMGRPKDFQDEATEGHNESSHKKKQSSFAEQIKLGKRLFRNTDEAVLGGVCSGLSAYLGIKDPIIIRILFLILIFGFGVSIFFYLLLWIIIPEAKTSSDRLEMKGQAVNIDSLSKMIVEEANKFGKKLKDFGDDLNEKMHSKGFSKATLEDLNIKQHFGQHTDQIFKGLGQAIRAVSKVLGTAGLILFSILWIVVMFIGIKSFTVFSLIPDITLADRFIGSSSLILLVGLPIFYLGYKCSQMIFRSKMHPMASGILVGIWVISWIGFGFSASKAASKYSEPATVTQNLRLEPQTDVITFIGKTDALLDESFMEHLDIAVQNDLQQIPGMNTQLLFRESAGQDFSIAMHLTARGLDQAQAKRHANQIELPIQVNNGIVELPLQLPLLVNEKYIGQSAKIEVFVPKGKRLNFGPKVLARMPYFPDKEQCEFYTLTENVFACQKVKEDIKLTETIEAL